MALQSWKCLDCERDFKAGDWECTPGQKHRVEEKRYFMDDAPTVPEQRDGKPFINKAIARTQILNIPPERRVQEGNEMRVIPGGDIWFIRGLYSTNDPEIQFHLDRRAARPDGGGFCSEERWRDVYLNDDEKLNIQRMELAAERQRLENDRNDLLAKVKAMESGKKPKAEATA